MATGPTRVTDVTEIVPEILEEAVRGAFAQKQVLMDSPLVSGGAVLVNGTLPDGRVRARLGNGVNIPYFGSIGEFESRTESQSASLRKIGTTEETCSVTRASLAFEISSSAQYATVDDVYGEHARQIMESARRYMEMAIITEAATSPLVQSYYDATTPAYIDYQKCVEAKFTRMGDEAGDIVAMVVHSLIARDLQAQVDSQGRPLFVGPNEQRTPSPAGIPLLISDRVPLTSSTMGTVTSTGTSPPVATITGTPTGPFNLVLDCVVGGAHETATVRFSTDGGNTYSDALTTAAAGVGLALTDTAVDSLVGVDGATGLTVAFAAGTFNADNTWSSTAKLKAQSQIYTRGAMAFWYDQAGLQLRTDTDILEDTDLAAMHLYSVAHLYRRRRMGKRPGVVLVDTNVSGYVG